MERTIDGMARFRTLLAGMDYGHTYLTRAERRIALSLNAGDVPADAMAHAIAKRRHDEDRENRRTTKAWLRERRAILAR